MRDPSAAVLRAAWRQAAQRCGLLRLSAGIVPRRHLGNAVLRAAGNAAASGDDAPRPGERLRPPRFFCGAAARKAGPARRKVGA